MAKLPLCLFQLKSFQNGQQSTIVKRADFKSNTSLLFKES